jgi:chromosome segregation ATPase
MNSAEPALRTLRSQVHFELVQAAADLAQASERTARASSRVEDLQRRAEVLLRELRQVLARTPLNAALLDALRCGHRVDQAELREWETRRIAARLHEQQLREALADLRNQDRSLERALQAEQRKQQARAQARDLVQADELWLQHSLRDAT